MALAAAPAAGARIGTSDYNATNHAIVVWPEATGGLWMQVEAIESPTPKWRVSFSDIAGSHGPSPGTIDPSCTSTINAFAPDVIECPVATVGELQNGIEVWTGDGVDGVSVNSAPSLTPAPVAFFLRDGNGTGPQEAIGGEGDDYFNTTAGDDTSGGYNYLQGGAGVDQYEPSANAYDLIDYFDVAHGSTNPVNVTFDCVANDGNATIDGGLENAGCTAQHMNGVQGTLGNDTLTNIGGGSMIYGMDGDDTMVGGNGTDQMTGGDGNDDITGGGGHDLVKGDHDAGAGAGNDTIHLRDSFYDVLDSCGGGTDSVQLDDAATEQVSATALLDCETLEYGPSGGGGGGGGSGEIDPTKTFTMPDYRPVRSGKSYRYKTLRDARHDRDAAGINLHATVSYVPLTRILKPLRESVDDGDIVKQSVEPGTVLIAGIAAPFPDFNVTVYREALDYKGKRCPYGKPKVMKALLKTIDGAPLAFALATLKKRGCAVKRLKDIIDKKATDATIYGANVFNKKTTRGRELAISLLVHRPPRQDFRINVTERPPAELGSHPSFKKEIGIGTDGKLTAGLASAVVHLDLFEAVTGRQLRGLEVKVVRSDEVVLASTKTSSLGGLTFTVPVDFTGELDIRVNLDVAGSGGYETLEAWHSIDVVNRKQKSFYTKSGRYFKWSKSKNRYLPATSPMKVSTVHKQIVDRMRELTQGLVGRNPAFATAAEILANTSTPPQQLLQDVANNVGLLPGALLAGTKPDGKITGATIAAAPAVQIGPGGGLLPTTMPVALLPAVGDIDTATLIGPDGASLIGMDGATLIGPDGGTLIGLDSATLANISGTSLIGFDGATFAPGMKLISDKGVGLGGSGFVPVR